MAHHVRITKVALHSKKDGHILKGKYIYRVKCKRCGNLHPDTRITSEGMANLATVNHHLDVSNRHSINHPNDQAHKRVIRNKVKKAGTRGN